MDGKNLPPQGAQAWQIDLRELMDYCGSSSPKELAGKFDPPRLGYNTIYRITKLQDVHSRWRAKLAELSGMLELPVETLYMFYTGDADGIGGLEFTRESGAEIKQFLLGRLKDAGISPEPPASDHEQEASPRRRRRA